MVGEKIGDPQAEPKTKGGEAATAWGKTFWSVVSALLVSTGVFGASLQWLQWNYQNTVSIMREDAAKLLDVEKSLSELIESRYFTSRRIISRFETSSKSADFAGDERDFSEIQRKWYDREPSLRGDVEYYVDAPSGRSTANKRAAIAQKNPECVAYAFSKDSTLDAGSASDVLQVSAHCQELIATDVQQLLDARKSGRAAGVDFAVDDTRLDHLWWINDVLRCIVMERAIVLHNSSPTLFGGVAVSSRSSGQRDCLKDYCTYKNACEASPQSPLNK